MTSQGNNETSSQLVRRCIEEKLAESKEIKSTRSQIMQDTGKDIFTKMDADGGIEAFKQFSEQLIQALQSAFDDAKKHPSLEDKKCQMWATFHQLRLSELPVIWEKFFTSMKISSRGDPMLAQSVNQYLFEKLYVDYCSKTFNNQKCPLLLT